VQVVEFRGDSRALETWKSPEVLGLHPRDVYLFAGSGFGQRAIVRAAADKIL
jgi:hypothetical protein